MTINSVTLLKEIRNIVREEVANALTDERAKSRMLTSRQVMDMFSISRTTLWRLTSEDGLKIYKAANRRGNLYKADEVERLIAKADM